MTTTSQVPLTVECSPGAKDGTEVPTIRIEILQTNHSNGNLADSHLSSLQRH